MDSDQEYERFDVDNDFEGGEFVDGEFYYASKRQKRAQTKEDQLYGVFAENSDDEREERRFGSRVGGKRADYTKPVGFVGGGVVKQGPDEEQQEEDDYASSGARAGLGAVAAQGGRGLGFSSATVVPPLQPPARAAEDAGDDAELMPTAFGRRIQKAAEQRRQAGEAAARAQCTQQGAEAGRPAAATGTGAFEAHTKGIGAKLLSKMGWQEGKGLGKEGRGIAKPLEAQLRPKGMGMGFGERREPQMAPVAAKPKVAPTAGAAAVDVRQEAKLWKKKHAEQRVRQTFKTADEVLAEAEERGVAPPLQAVIDMRGPRARVVTNLEHLNVREGEEEEAGGGGASVPMPELQHNVRLLVDMAVADIQRLDARLRHERDTQTILQGEARRLAAEVAATAEAAERLAALLAAVGAARGGGAAPSLPALRAAFADLWARYREDYVMHNLAAVALASAVPLLAEALAGWSPLHDPEGPAAEFAAWRPLLEGDSRRHGALPSSFAGDAAALPPFAVQDPYTRLVVELLLPRLRKALATEWEPRNAAPLEGFLEVWEPLLPAAVVGHVMLHLVLPRLRAALGEWDPLKDPVAPHTWVHPWLPFLGHHMAELWPSVRFKFSAALQRWHPADASAQAVLSPWRLVFGDREWEALLQRCVVPKLAAALSELVVNPADQQLEPFGWVMAWADLLPAKHMASLLDAHFFPKWHAVLRHWLANAPDYDEVTRWYLAWKQLFPPALLDHERLRAQMGAALNAMNTAVEGRPLPTTWTPAPPAPGPAAAADDDGGVHPSSYEEAYGPPHVHPPRPTFDPDSLTLRELVERYAEEAGVEFAPKAGRTYEGLQVYHFGRVSCVVDGAHGVLRAQLGAEHRWEAASMEGLLREHQAREQAAAQGRRRA